MRHTCSLIFFAWSVACGCAARTHAQPEAEQRTSGEPASETPSRWALGVRGFGGVLFSEGDARGGAGAGGLVAFSVVPERWEVELGLSAVGTRAGALGVFEVAGKRTFERHAKWAPHLLLGPTFSLDFGDERQASGGLLVGGGITHWLSARIGLVGDAAYRLLIGSEIEDVLTLAVGLSFRL